MTKPKRQKAYREKPIVRDPMLAAFKKCSVLTDQERATIIKPALAALNDLRTGKLDATGWGCLCQCALIAEVIADLGICSDDASRKTFADMLNALGTYTTRANATGCKTAKGPEIAAITAGIEHHDLQMSFVSVNELGKAVKRVKSDLHKDAKPGREWIDLNLLETA